MGCDTAASQGMAEIQLKATTNESATVLSQCTYASVLTPPWHTLVNCPVHGAVRTAQLVRV